MIASLRLTDAAVRFGGTLFNPEPDLASDLASNLPSNLGTEFDSVSIDSRKTEHGDLFVALIGERLDAHDYLYQVADKASGLVVSKVDKQLPLAQWVVEDTTVALGQLAQLQREQFTGTVVAVTGSTGKTSVKELIASILGQLGSVHFTKGNFNNHIGVPLTLLSMENDADFAVIEMGASGGGEIGYLCEIAQPHIALINNVQLAHIEGFGSIEGIAAAKGEIYSGLQESGIAVLNIDQSWVDQWRDLIGNRECITFSVNNSAADISAANIENLDNGCCRFDLKVAVGTQTAGGTQMITLSIPGRHSVSNALAAAACAAAAGANLEQIAAGLEMAASPARRLEIKTLPSGGVIIDDSYNASPSSVRAAIDVLASSAGRKVMVLGDMAELGADEEPLHQQVGEYAVKSGIDALYTLGNLSAFASMAFNGQHFEDLDLLKLALLEEGKSSDLTILVKGSRSSQMDLVVDMLLAENS